MTTENRDFKGVWIPKEIWLDERLNATEKIIFVEIDSLDSTERGCWASNDYIAAFCQCSARTVSAAISKLTKLGYIYVQSFDGRQRELKSKYTPAPIPRKNCEADTHEPQNSLADVAIQHSKNCEADMQELRESNTVNKTSNNTVNKKKKENVYDEILDSVIDAELKNLYRDFIQMRVAIKAPMTTRALQMLIDKVNQLEPTSIDRQKKMLENAIINNWKSVYPLKDDNGKKYGKTGIEVKAPEKDDVLAGIL